MQRSDCVRMVHLQQNAQAYVPRQDMKAEVAADIRAILTAPSWAAADALLARTVQKYAKTASTLAAWMETALPEGLSLPSRPPTANGCGR